MIRSFACDDTELVFNREFSRKFNAIARVAHRRLLVLNRATRLDDMRHPPGNRLEALRGNLAGRYSVRINDQWRIVFAWRDDEPHDVEIMDYH
ncbi:MAG: type II toxin-antitoxin system RelE/ParE family toxin [Hyphomonadaceae bacterium]|nr:type II toxin-antitoxin system RelE/ParE family toxin [Hyphomonadaceae bacterium]